MEVILQHVPERKSLGSHTLWRTVPQTGNKLLFFVHDHDSVNTGVEDLHCNQAKKGIGYMHVPDDQK